MEKLSEAFRKRLLGIRAQYPWANWFAEDETGVGYVYEEKPEIKLNAEFWVAADGEGRALMREFGFNGYNAGCRKEEDRNNYFELSIPDLFWNFPDYKEPKPEKKERTLKVHGREFSETTVWNALRFYLKRPEDC